MRYRTRAVRPRLADLSTARRGVYLVPNLVTTAGLFCGVFSIVQTMHGHYVKAALAIIAAAIFDGLDGRIARMTNTSSRFGIEYDSLSDVIAFGVAPGVLIDQWALIPWGAWGWLAMGLYVTCSALRLARFNTSAGIMTSGHFVGLPVPASAVLLASVVLMYRYVGRSGLPDKHVALLLVSYLLAALMVSSVPYPSFKNLKLHRRQPLGMLVLGILLLKVLIAEYRLMIFVAITIYIATGPVLWAWSALRQGRRGGAEVAEPGAERSTDPDVEQRRAGHG